MGINKSTRPEKKQLISWGHTVFPIDDVVIVHD